MDESNAEQDEGQAGLAGALDWRAARTWWIFTVFAVGLGATSGLIIVATEVVGAKLIAPEVTDFNLVAQMVSVAFHCGAFYLLSRMVPLRSADGTVLHEHSILFDTPEPPEAIANGFLPLIAWTGTISAVAVLVILGQPFFELPDSVATQAWLPIAFAMGAARFPASAVLAKSCNGKGRAGAKS